MQAGLRYRILIYIITPHSCLSNCLRWQHRRESCSLRLTTDPQFKYLLLIQLQGQGFAVFWLIFLNLSLGSFNVLDPVIQRVVGIPVVLQGLADSFQVPQPTRRAMMVQSGSGRTKGGREEQGGHLAQQGRYPAAA